jgi:hypothetical protein
MPPCIVVHFQTDVTAREQMQHTLAEMNKAQVTILAQVCEGSGGHMPYHMNERPLGPGADVTLFDVDPPRPQCCAGRQQRSTAMHLNMLRAW